MGWSISNETLENAVGSSVKRGNRHPKMRSVRKIEIWEFSQAHGAHGFSPVDDWTLQWNHPNKPSDVSTFQMRAPDTDMGSRFLATAIPQGSNMFCSELDMEQSMTFSMAHRSSCLLLHFLPVLPVAPERPLPPHLHERCVAFWAPWLVYDFFLSHLVLLTAAIESLFLLILLLLLL